MVEVFSRVKVVMVGIVGFLIRNIHGGDKCYSI